MRVPLPSLGCNDAKSNPFEKNFPVAVIISAAGSELFVIASRAWSISVRNFGEKRFSFSPKSSVHTEGPVLRETDIISFPAKSHRIVNDNLNHADPY